MSEDKKQNEIIRIQKKRNNFVMLDKGFLEDSRLSYKAKGILAYLLSKPDNWKVIVRDLISHAKDGRDSIYTGLKELKDCGYYSKTPIRNEKGIVIRWESIIFEDPTENPENMSLDPLTDFPYLDNPYTENGQRNNNYINNNNYSNIESKSSQSQTVNSKTEKSDMTNDIDVDITQQSNIQDIKKELPETTMPTKANGFRSPFKNKFIVSDYTTYQTIIQDNIEYYYFLENRSNDIKLLDEIVNCMLDVICTGGDTVKIGGEDKSRSMVISQYLKLNYMDIEHILERYKEQRHKITHINNYLKTMLYTVRLESGHYYANAVRADGTVY